MKFKYNYHRDLSTLHIGCEKPRSYFIPYESAKAADEGVRGKSSRFVNLCGEDITLQGGVAKLFFCLQKKENCGIIPMPPFTA